jgi:hypothetical protein
MLVFLIRQIQAYRHSGQNLTSTIILNTFSTRKKGINMIEEKR